MTDVIRTLDFPLQGNRVCPAGRREIPKEQPPSIASGGHSRFRAGVGLAEVQRLSRRTVSHTTQLGSPNRSRSRPAGLNNVFPATFVLLHGGLGEPDHSGWSLNPIWRYHPEDGSDTRS